MDTRQYKTNINCNECVAKVTQHLNRVYGINSWEVDTRSKDKVLTVNGNYKEEELRKAIQDSGFRIQE